MIQNADLDRVEADLHILLSAITAAYSQGDPCKNAKTGGLAGPPTASDPERPYMRVWRFEVCVSQACVVREQLDNMLGELYAACKAFD